MSVIIRDATDADLLTLVDIDSAATPFPWSVGQFAESLANHRVLVSEEGGEVCGFLVFNRVVDEVELLNVAVDPARQGRGHGAALVTRLIELNRSHASQIFLEVRASNQRAIDLYTRLGFSRTGMRKGYYPALPDAGSAQGREDAWIMCHVY